MSDFTDLTGRHQVAVYGKPITVDGGYFSGRSTLFPSETYLQISDLLGDFEFAAGPFCVEFAFKVMREAVGGGYFTVVGNYVYAGTSYGWEVKVSNTTVFVSNTWTATSFSATPGDHVMALTRDAAGVIRIFLDGLIRFSWTPGNPYAWGFSGQKPLLIGAKTPGTAAYLSYLRISSVARYTASYTPRAPLPGAADPFWANTVLFLRMTGAATAPPTDVGLTQVGNGVFDLMFYDAATQDQDLGLETLVYAALFTDAEAPAAREPDRYARRGWWANPDAGSGLWHVRRQGLTAAGRAEAIEMIRSALAARAPAITDVVVTDISPAGSVSGLFVEIAGAYAGREFVKRIPL